MPKVSVITPAYLHLEELLNRALPSIEAQTFRDFEHLIVHDGPNPELRHKMEYLGYKTDGDRKFIELGRNFHSFFGGDGPNSETRGSRAVSPAMIGTYLASGNYISYLDDDCSYRPEHLEMLTFYLDAMPSIDFAYGIMERFLDGQYWDQVGDGLIECGHIDGNMIVHRIELLKIANWQRGPANDPLADWNLFRAWKEAGASWFFYPEVTCSWYGNR